MIAADPFAPSAGRCPPQTSLLQNRRAVTRRLPHATGRARRRSRRSDRSRAHRALRRAPRRASPRLHAAARDAEDYLALVAAVEDTAASDSACRCASKATRRRTIRACNVLKVTPDPGVIEVNIHPAANWDELVDITDGALRGGAPGAGSAPRNSCSTAATPAPAAATTSCSAARRRPTARSCAGPICCAAWSATGTTIRRCRICSPACSSARPARRRASTKRATTALRAGDRVRADARSDGRRCPALARRPHLPPSAGRRDRQHAPRRVLHRQALLARQPDRPARPGRVPRVRDAAARADEPGAAAAAARRWSRGSGRSPIAATLVRWGTALHDRFMLPHFVAQDFATCSRISTPRASRSRPTGSRRTSSFAFRCIGTRRPRRTSQLELRQAIEPWHVLGEESAAAAPRAMSIRSVERAAGEGAGTDRSRVTPSTCNGRRVPLHADRDARRVRRRRSLPRLAAAVVPASRPSACTRRWSSTSSIRWSGARSAAARITSRIPAGAITTPSRSTPTRPKAAGWRVSRRSATRQADGARGADQPRLPADAGPAALLRSLCARPCSAWDGTKKTALPGRTKKHTDGHPPRR